MLQRKVQTQIVSLATSLNIERKNSTILHKLFQEIKGNFEYLFPRLCAKTFIYSFVLLCK